MALERLGQESREIKFGGERKALGIKLGFAITTLRNPKPAYNFSRGEVILADCFDDNEKVPVVVLTNEIKELKSFSVPQLALDGFFSVSDVIDGMKTYPGYEKIKRKSLIQAITFVKKESFDSLPEDVKEETISGNFDFDELIRSPVLRHLFFPTIFNHIMMEENVEDYLEFLIENNLVTDSAEDRKWLSEHFSKFI